MDISVAFTGHRPNKLYGYADTKPWTALRDKIAESLEALCSRYDNVVVITGGAQGIDQTAFWASIKLRKEGLPIRSIVYVPFEGQSSPWKAKGLFSQDEYARMLRAADEVRIISDTRPKDGREASMMMFARDAAMVDDAEMLIAVSDIDINNIPTRGGTAHTIRYAKKAGKPVAFIRP